MDIRSVKLVLVLLLVVCVGSAPPLWSQSASSGTVSGIVTDPSNAVVAGAAITLTDIATNISRTANSNATGRYFFADVTPGTYTLTVAKAGFATTKTENQTVQVGVNLTANLSLQVGGANVVVEVSSVGNELQTMNATVGNTINSVTIDNLPSLGRDVSTFVELQPGVGPDGSVGGAVLDQNYFSLDGGDNTNDMDGSMNVYTKSYAGDPTGGVATQNNLGTGNGGPTGVIPTPQDSVEEFKVNTAGQTADFNSSAGAEVKIVTKRGTNSWHGTGYEYYKDNNWSSQSWQNDYNNSLQPGSAPLPSFHYSRYGGSIGGPIIPKEILGGKTYFFFNYEGFNFPQSITLQRNVPSQTLMAGEIIDPVTNHVYQLGGPTGIDPLHIGLNPLVSQIWNTYEPQSNAACYQQLCDGTNVQGFAGNIGIPITSKFVATRLDHDFSPKWHFNATYHFYKLTAATTDQVDIGGFFPGDTKGVPASLSRDPAEPQMWAASLTTNITSNTTNDFHYSFLRNFWQWIRQGDTPQLAGLGGALEIMSGQELGEASDLGPYDVNTQNTRTRFWDGHDQLVRDDVSNLKGNHLLQFGGTYQHNWNQHQRTDNGGGINYAPVYSLGIGNSGSGLASGSDLSICTATTDIPNCAALTAAALGIVSISQIAYTRSGASLTLNPPLTPAEDTLTIPYFNTYFSDTWHMKPTFTLTYGLGWTLEQPPTEATGKQDVLVDASDTPVSMSAYLAQRKAAALIGQVYNPALGFALVHNVGDGSGRVYDPYYGEFSPRIAVAWSPHFDADSPMGKIFGHEDTVIRGGYGRIYGRLNGVDQALVPLLGVGPIQPVQCANNLFANGGSCPSGLVTASPSTAFRIGATENGLIAPLQTASNLIPSATLPQPLFTGINTTEGSASEALDPHFRPNVSDSFNFTVQRQLARRVTLEFGYIGRRITHEYQPINLNAVPYMMTLGGQQFKQAYANTVLQYCGGIAGLAGGGCAAVAGNVTTQPFFETALGGASSHYCSAPVLVGSNMVTPTSCTNAVVLNEGANLANAQVWSLWSDLDSGPMQTIASGGQGGVLSGPTMLNNSGQFSSGVASNGSIGYGNYNAGFASVKMADWRGLTMQSNFTWSKALGTGGVVQASSEITPDDPFNLGTTYGYQDYDRKFVYNAFFVYQPPFFKGQNGLVGRALGGWSFASVFTAGSGLPVEIFTTTGDGQEYGAGDNVNFFGNENAIQIAPIAHGHAYYNNPSGGLPVNMFKAGTSAINDFRNPILGLDNKDGGNGNIFGLPYWNMDLSIRKNIMVTEGISMELQGVFANVFNHNQWLDPSATGTTGLFSSSLFGALPGSSQEQLGGDRQIEVGFRVRF
ncbi:MAG: carboxypeptidase regulatory-like domain-containing protein [Candidatus Sulfotelmatobacter sp.]